MRPGFELFPSLPPPRGGGIHLGQPNVRAGYALGSSNTATGRVYGMAARRILMSGRFASTTKPLALAVLFHFHRVRLSCGLLGCAHRYPGRNSGVEITDIPRLGHRRGRMVGIRTEPCGCGRDRVATDDQRDAVSAPTRQSSSGKQRLQGPLEPLEPLGDLRIGAYASRWPNAGFLTGIPERWGRMPTWDPAL